MEDENGLELSLGLSFGGSSVKSKSKNGSSSDTKADEVGRGGKTTDEFKNFFHAGIQKPDSIAATQRTDPTKPEENFFNDLSRAKEDNGSVNLNGRGLWVANNNKPEEDKRLETGNKRKMLFDEINHQKKHESEVHHADLNDRARTSRIPLTDDGSTAENEDVADSEAENSTSRPISLHGDGSKWLMRAGGSSDAPREGRGVIESSTTDLNGQKRLSGSSDKDFKIANLNYGAPFSVQQVNMMNVPYPSPVKESNNVSAPSPQIPAMMHVMPTATTERSGTQPVNNGNLHVMLGYPSVQLPMLDKDSSWGSVSHPQQLHHSFVGRGPTSSAAMHVISNNLPEGMPYDGRPLERTKGDGKLHITEEGSSFQAEDVKGSSTNLRAKDSSEQSKGEGLSVDFSAIKPGLAAEVKFGGSGSYPNLPWVSTAGSGPNGRTISGVTYKYGTNQIKIVCACHGSHMSPEEFVRHANEDNAKPEGGAITGTVANGNPAASAHG
ncbi:hypothetical protein L6164_005232 [Bauhinia variegata]|uniref:Uncharacterized protein n=1 Tax=Bauhinia variegata TaxID=167791 RepID=A0ACB9PQ75_BAUVA|nr:hypothetical protein L6164_005232 [Bauhinia variegata]